MINNYCKQYRIDKGLTLNKLITLSGFKCKVGTLSAFESGRSSNIKHLELYIVVSDQLNDSSNFINNLKKEVLQRG